jgi:MFS family permease
MNGAKQAAQSGSPTLMNAIGMRSRVPLGRRLWVFVAATTVSLAGGFMQKIAVGWSVWDTTHSTAWVAAAGLADLFPTLVLSAPAGAYVDRLRPQRTFWIAQLAAALQALVLWALAASGHLTLGAVMACTAVLGAANAFTVPARFAYITQLTPRERYAGAVALNSLGGNVAFFAGPMIAGELISTLDVGAAFAAGALASLPVIGVSLALPMTDPTAAEKRPPEGILRQTRDGFSYAARNPELLRMLLSFAAVACTARGIMELAPSIAATALRGSVKTLSSLTSSVALGALVAGLCMSRFGRWGSRAMIATTLAGAAVALIGYGASGRLSLALSGAILLGFTLAVNNISVSTEIQLLTSPGYRGRINSLYNMIFKGGPAIGAVVFGGLGQVANVRIASGAAAILLVLLTLWLTRRPLQQP